MQRAGFRSGDERGQRHAPVQGTLRTSCLTEKRVFKFSFFRKMVVT